MIAHRNRDEGSIVGWFFVCKKCEPEIAGTEVSMYFPSKTNTKGN